MRKLRRIPKQRALRRPLVPKTIDETLELDAIESDFEAEYQAFIQELRSRKEKNEKVTETSNTQDIQPD